MAAEKRITPAVCHRAAKRLRVALLAFCAAATAGLIAIYAVAPDIYVQTLMLHPDPAAAHPLAATLFMAAVVLFVAVLAIGIARRWRWLFWLVLLAFTLSALQIVALPFELAGAVSPHIPAWYALLRALVAVVQLAIGLWMIRIYRRCGVWGMGPARRGSSA